MLEQKAAAGPQWRRRKAERPSEIASAALACFAERGYAATRLDDVAQRAGVTKGTLYLYFPTKEELFKAVVREAVVTNLVSAELLVEQSTEPAPALLAELLTRWSKAMETSAGAISKIVLAEAGNFPDMSHFYLEEVIDRSHRLYARVLRLGIERGEFRPVDVESTIRCIVAPLLLGALWRHSFEKHEGRPIDMTALLHSQLQILSRGLAPDRA